MGVLVGRNCLFYQLGGHLQLGRRLPEAKWLHLVKAKAKLSVGSQSLEVREKGRIVYREIILIAIVPKVQF